MPNYVVWIIDLMPMPKYMMALMLIPLFGTVYLFGLIPFFERSGLHDIIAASISIIFAIGCYTHEWWIKIFPQSFLRFFDICGYVIAALLSIVLPLYLIYW